MSEPTDLTDLTDRAGPRAEGAAAHASGATDPADAVRQRARDSLDHLQAAAHELIDAARAALDAAERFIDDPEMMSAVAGAAGRIGEVLKSVTPERSRRHDGPFGSGGAGEGETGEPGIQRITIR